MRAGKLRRPLSLAWQDLAIDAVVPSVAIARVITKPRVMPKKLETPSSQADAIYNAALPTTHQDSLSRVSADREPGWLLADAIASRGV
jgi:hypothetical protein